MEVITMAVVMLGTAVLLLMTLLICYLWDTRNDPKH